MAERVIGLDIGTNAVRVAEVVLGARPQLRAFGQVALPPGAMREGEVAGPDLVSGAIRRLWREVGLRGTAVRVGIASQRVIVRTIDMPALADAELASALQFQVQEYIPIPIDDAVLDFQVVESLSGPDGEPLNRVLVAAAHREVVANTMAAVEGAGLRATAIDLVPFALIRALASPVVAEGRAEAIVSIGSGVTTVVVHEAGVPRFVRVVATGGNMLTDAISQELGVPTEEAESLKRRVGRPALDVDAADTDLVDRAKRVLDSRMLTLVGEVRGSLDYYAAQAGAAPVERVLLTGGAVLTEGLDVSLQALLALPVEVARPRERIDVGDIGFEAADLPSLDPYLPVPVGLALGGGKVEGRRISLLPRAARTALVQRQITGALAAAGALVLLVLLLLTVARTSQVSSERHKVATQEATNQSLQAQIARFDEAQQLERDAVAVRQRVAAVLANDVSWPRLLQDIARTIPNNVWLSGLTAQIVAAPSAPGVPAPSTAPTTPTSAGGPPVTAPVPAAPAVVPFGGGSVNFTAVGLEFPAVAAWLQRMARIPWLSGLWVPSSQRSELGGRQVVNFTSTASINPSARSDRLQRFTGEAR